MRQTALLPTTLRPPDGHLLAQSVPLQDFLDWQPEVNGLKYQWKDGEILFGEDSIQQNERSVVANIVDRFAETSAHRDGGRTFPETDCYLAPSDSVRRPDLAFFTLAQRREGDLSRNPVPLFVVEIVSKHDLAIHIENKLRDYFAAGVQVVWYIYPTLQAVRVFRSFGESTLVKRTAICSAAPVIAEFQIPAEELFRTP